MGKFIALFFVLVILKLTGLLTISWWLVTLPLWGVPAILIGAIIAFWVGLFLIMAIGWIGLGVMTICFAIRDFMRK